ncbi:Fur family transcriptional regulator [Paenibacillus thermoaerophilus]|uniref:Fur family transcriptional regulator n=1 Tax=Paenibacillus thermoaerophilus TaxID=1215385 RepID=A0ABW2V2G8_9BACL|nr:Fur family transcriptional regulator [Paenibacillus thermoaerophilus]TMV18813.1 transcriptional repressor [Paenibacillus thermoaerophilus]
MTVEEMLRDMSVRGLRITEQRRTLSKLFVDAEGYLTPKDVYEYMNKSYPGLSFDTVYRNLRVLHELGILEQFVFEDGIKFRVRCQDDHHHHHLICLGCDRIEPIRYCPMTGVEGIPDDFEVVRHKFEVFGYCSQCRREGESDG